MTSTPCRPPGGRGDECAGGAAVWAASPVPTTPSPHIPTEVSTPGAPPPPLATSSPAPWLPPTGAGGFGGSVTSDQSLAPSPAPCRGAPLPPAAPIEATAASSPVINAVYDIYDLNTNLYVCICRKPPRGLRHAGQPQRRRPSLPPLPQSDGEG